MIHIQRAGGSEFLILGALTLKLQASNEVQRSGTGSRLVFDNLRQ